MDFLKRIFFVDILKGLYLTFQYTYGPVYTEQYPTERPRIAERYKGAPRLNNDPETGETRELTGKAVRRDGFTIACPKREGAIWFYRAK